MCDDAGNHVLIVLTSRLIRTEHSIGTGKTCDSSTWKYMVLLNCVTDIVLDMY